MESEERFAIAFPQLCKLTLDPEGGFRGLTVFLGDSNSVVIGVKRFSVDGAAEIMWSSGHDLLDAFINLNEALKADRWRVDKHFIA